MRFSACPMSSSASPARIDQMAVVIRLVLSVGFSLLYVAMYPMLIGGFVIYWYPYWPAPIAAAYVIGGILLQAWFCFRGATPVTSRSVATQALTGLGYLIAACLVNGGPYQS